MWQLVLINKHKRLENSISEIVLWRMSASRAKESKGSYLTPAV